MFYSDLIPQKEMFKYNWFKPKKHSHWFYHRPLKNSKDINLQDSSEIYRTIDPYLKDIFVMVTLKGYRTLPSCQGHFHPLQTIRSKYKAILNDLEDIKNDGLELEEIENKNNILYKNKNYELNWNSFKDFKDNVEDNMSVGYFGIINPKGLESFKSTDIEIKIEKNILKYPISHIIINHKDDQSINKNWKNVFDYLYKNLK